MTARRFAIATAVLLLFSASAAQAQERRSGFWLGVGAGSGWDIPTSIVVTDVPEGAAAVLRAGGTLNPQVLFGVEVLGRAVNVEDATEYRGHVAFIMQIFPGASGLVFVKGGIGPAFVGKIQTGGHRGTYTLGLGLSASVGFDLPMWGNLYLTPSADFLYQSFNAGANLLSTHRLLLGTIALTWH